MVSHLPTNQLHFSQNNLFRSNPVCLLVTSLVKRFSSYPWIPRTWQDRVGPVWGHVPHRSQCSRLLRSDQERMENFELQTFVYTQKKFFIIAARVFTCLFPKELQTKSPPNPEPGWGRSWTKVFILVPEGNQRILFPSTCFLRPHHWLEIEGNLSLLLQKVNNCSPWVNMKASEQANKEGWRFLLWPARTTGLSTQQLRRWRLYCSSGLPCPPDITPPSSLCWRGSCLPALE